MKTTIIAAAFVFLGSAIPTWAGLFDIETKLTASDAAEGDLFGSSVAISGNTAIIGANADDDAGSNSGSAYLFNATTGNQILKLTADDAAEGDQFGSSVAISGNSAIIGAPLNDELGIKSGSAYLFDADPLSPAFGDQLFNLTASDASENDSFGSSVAISGNSAIIGANADDDAGSASGSAYLFDVTTGSQLTKLTASDAASLDVFGFAVGISGNTAIVGAQWDDDAGSSSGSAYLFDVDPLSPTFGDQLFKLTADDAAEGDYFGVSVAISGNLAIVGALFDGDDGDFSGSVYLFDVTTGSQLIKLTADDAAAGDNFGNTVAISGNTAIVGALGRDEASGVNSGSVYLFNADPLSPTFGDQLLKLTAFDAAASDLFGYSVAISGNLAIVGARGNDDAGDFSGSAYLFVPEPSALAIAAVGILGLSICRFRDLAR